MSRTLLTWLCCALTLCVGVPLRAKAPCADDSRTPSCCAPDQCACAGENAAPAACACGERQPQPTVPTPRPEQLPAPEPMRRPLAAFAEPEAQRNFADQVGLPIGLLPRVSRQAALSVWRC